MSAFLALWLLLVGGGCQIAFTAAAGYAMNRAKGPTRRERAIENVLEEVRELAYTYRDVDQGLAEAVIDRIKTFNRTEK